MAGKHTALPDNKETGWMWLTITNTLAYYPAVLITPLKSFATLASSIYNFLKKINKNCT
jgi:hypothetical protein